MRLRCASDAPQNARNLASKRDFCEKVSQSTLHNETNRTARPAGVLRRFPEVCSPIHARARNFGDFGDFWGFGAKNLRPGTKKIAQSRSLSHSEARKRAKRLRCGPPRAGQCIDHCGSRRYTLRDFEGKPRAEAARAVWAPFGAMSEARSRSAEPRAAARGFPEAFRVARDVAQVSRARAKSSVGTLGA